MFHLLPLYFTICCPEYLSLRAKEPLGIVKRKCTCALVLHVVLPTILYKSTVPAVRPSEHVPEATSSQQQHVVEGDLVSPSCCSDSNCQATYRLLGICYLTLNCSPKALRRLSRRSLLRHIPGQHRNVQFVGSKAQCHHIHARPRAQARTPPPNPSRACPAATPPVTQACRPRYRIRMAAGALLAAPPPAFPRKSPSATCADSRPAATWRRLTT